jgi:hypothetical protein
MSRVMPVMMRWDLTRPKLAVSLSRNENKLLKEGTFIMMKILGLISMAGAILAVNGSLAHAAPAPKSAPMSAIEELSAENQAKVRNGEQITLTEPSQTSAYPQIWVYQRVDATPEEVMAVLLDLDHQLEYVPDMLYSKIGKRIDKTTFEVGYTIATHVSLHPRESYTLRDKLSGAPADGNYRLDWKMIASGKIRDIVGYARIEPLGTGALVAYYNLITPPSLGAGQSQKAISGVKATVSGLGGRVLKVRSENQPLLQQEIGALRSALTP